MKGKRNSEINRFQSLSRSKFETKVLRQWQTFNPANGRAVLQNVSSFHTANFMTFVTFFLSFGCKSCGIQRKRMEK